MRNHPFQCTSVERNGGTTHKVSTNDAVQELQGAHGDQEDHEDVQQLGSLIRLVDVVPPHIIDDGLGVVRVVDLGR